MNSYLFLKELFNAIANFNSRLTARKVNVIQPHPLEASEKSVSNVNLHCNSYEDSIFILTAQLFSVSVP